MAQPKPIHYTVHLEPDLASFALPGWVDISLEASESQDEIVLNAAELTIQACSLQTEAGLVDCPFQLDEKREELHLTLPVATRGRIDLRIDFTGSINDKMAGFYRSRYRHEGRESHLAVTQFEESDARKAFPCVDHPRAKATFDVELVAPEGFSAVSNTTPAEERPLPGGKRLVRFARTPKMSTYLLFFGLGPFTLTEGKADRRVRALTVPGLGRYVSYGLDFGEKSLRYCESYFGIPYPLPKLDLIGVPDFAFGAMENWGAITFRENLLLHFPGITSREDEVRLCEVIAHEIVHQWFGNLVTPSDWKYLWLNESFATQFGFGVIAHYHPEWDVWEHFLGADTQSALERDSYPGTVAIEIPGGEHTVINASTAPIIYEKGGSVLRQVEGFIGQGAFQKGLQSYLRRHAYDCAESRDLWQALEEAAAKPITAMMRSWLEQKGLPQIDVRRHGRNLILHQKRFSYLPVETKGTWLVPVAIRLFRKGGSSETVSVMLDKPEMTIPVGEDVTAYKVNERQTGFYRVRYEEPSDRGALGALVASKALPAEDRWGLQNDLYALVKSGDASLEDYLAFLSSYYGHEEAFLPLAGIAENLTHAFLVLSAQKAADIGCSLLEPTLSRLGYDPKPGESRSASALRHRAWYPAVLLGSREAEAAGLARFRGLREKGTIPADILRSVLQIGAAREGESALGWLQDRLAASESEPERLNIVLAFGCLSPWPVLERALDYSLEKVPSRNRYMPIASAAANPQALPHLWGWYTSRFDRIATMHPLHHERVIIAVAQTAGLGREQQVGSFLSGYAERNPGFRGSVTLALEKLRVHARMRERLG